MWAESRQYQGRIPRRFTQYLLLFAIATLISTLVGCGGGNSSLLQSPGSVLAIQPQTVTFGSSQVGSMAAPQIVTLTNMGPAAVTILNVTSPPGFQLVKWPGPITLGPLKSAQLQLRFTPFASGDYTGFLQIRSQANYSLWNVSVQPVNLGPFNQSGIPATQTSTSTTFVPLSATSVNNAGDSGYHSPGQLAVNPSTLDFSSVVVGQSKTLTATLTASGSSVTVSSATPGTSEFSLSGLALPLTIAAGQSASFAVTFQPQASGTASTTVSFVSNASSSNARQTLTGSGTPLSQHSVDLSWTASTSSVVGYNIYRGTTSGGPYSKINTTLEASTTYTDGSVASGATYYYVTTAVNGSGVESTYSNQATALIPYP